MKHISNYAWFVILTLFTFNVYALPTAKITIKVVDENGVPVEGAKVAADFSVGGRSSLDSDLTDSDGLATLSNSGIRHVEYGAHKDGYYRSGNEYDFESISGFTGFRRWQPWNKILVLELRKIKNPRGLYIGNHDGIRLGEPLSLPGLDKEYSYDLIAQDWVVPYGLGLHRDFVFKLTGKTTGRREYDYSLNLTFSNEGDGILRHDAEPIYGSRLRLPHEAPLGGYQNELVQRQASTFDHFIANDFPEDRNYYFRVRTERDDRGNIVSALYGKIYGNIMFFPADTMERPPQVEPNLKDKVSMLYYLNPDSNDRNLESDYKKNLFPSKQKYGYFEYPP